MSSNQLNGDIHKLSIPELSRPKTLLKIKEKPDVSHLSETQKTAFDVTYKMTKHFVTHKQTMASFFSIRGYAGTGKTTLINAIVHALGWKFKDRYLKIMLLSPTHKATNNMKFMSPYDTTGTKIKLVYKTVHSALGLSETIDYSTGKLKFKRQGKFEPEITKADVIFIDEASMLYQEIFDYLKEFFPKKVVVFVSDDAQIPPISDGGVEMSPLYKPSTERDYEYPEFTLNKVFRQALDSPILALATEIRNKQVHNIGENNYDLEGGGVMYTGGISPDNPEFIKWAANHVDSQSFFTNPNHFKILCFRNDNVFDFNENIRDYMLGKDVDPITPKEAIVLRQPVVREFVDGEKTVFANQQTLRIYDVQEALIRINGEEYKVYRCELYPDENNPFQFDEKERYVNIIHPDSEAKHFTDVHNYALMAKAEINKYKRETYWMKYWKLVKAVISYERPSATTYDRSQGSTFSCSVLYGDLASLYKTRTMFFPRLYVGITRSSNWSIVSEDFNKIR